MKSLRSIRIAIAASAVSIALTAALAAELQPGLKTYLSTPGLISVLVAASLGGVAAGLGTMAINLFALWFFFGNPRGLWAPLTLGDEIRLASFLIASLFINLVSFYLRRAREKAELSAGTAAQLADELRLQTAELNDSFDSAAMPLHWVGPDGTILRANRAELLMMGLGAEQYIGRKVSDFHLDAALAQQMLTRVRNGETIRNEEVRIRGADGRTIHARITSNAYYRDGRFVHARSFTQDVTAQRLAEESLVRLKMELEVLVAQRTAELERTTEQLRARHVELTRLSRELVTVQEAERRSIARELHDHFGQLLTALALDLRLIEQGVGFPEQRRVEVARCIRSLDQVLHDLHNLAANLRPTTLDHLGLVEALRLYIESVRAQSGLQVQFESSLGEGRLSPETEIAVYRIVQEGVTNAVRHAHATRVDVVLSRNAGQISTVVEDDGIGFDVTSALSRGRLGLGGMRERATMLGGVLEIDTSPRHGTTLVARLPYAR